MICLHCGESFTPSDGPCTECRSTRHLPCPTPGCEFWLGHIAEHPCGKRIEARPTVEVANNELCTVRDAMRTLNLMVESLGPDGKYVLMKGGKMRAVLISFERYADLCADRGSKC